LVDFSFIQNTTLREMLREDYRELLTVLKADAPKSAVVLAGGIIEAVLLDYLRTVEFEPDKSKSPPDKDLKRAGLAELVAYASRGPTPAIAKGAAGMAGAAAALCDGVNQFRNRIHAGRALKGQDRPDMKQAKLVAEAVDLICREVAARALQHQKWAAEAVVAFAESNFMAQRELRKRLRRLTATELRRVLVEVIPSAVVSGGLHPESLWGCELCFSEAWAIAPGELRSEAALRVLETLESLEPPNEPSWKIDEALLTLFFPDLLGYLEAEDREALLSMMLPRLSALLDPDSSQPCLVGIGVYLNPETSRGFVRDLARAAVGDKKWARDYARESLVREYVVMDEDTRRSTIERIDEAAEKCRQQNRRDLAIRLTELRYSLEPLSDEDIPR
jgi:hypothetical protein